MLLLSVGSSAPTSKDDLSLDAPRGNVPSSALLIILLLLAVVVLGYAIYRLWKQGR